MSEKEKFPESLRLRLNSDLDAARYNKDQYIIGCDVYHYWRAREEYAQNLLRELYDS